MRFLADSSDYYDYLKGISNLTDTQKQVLYERLKSELPMTQPTPTQPLSLPTTANTTIRTALPNSDKPTYMIDCCLHCGSTAINKIGKTKGGMQRYLCKDCHKSFSENYGLITHYSHLSEWQWQEAIRATVVSLSLTELAKNINVSTKTAWLCRMKIYDMLKKIYGYCDTFNSIVEADGKYERISFKGCKDKSFFIDKLGRLPRHHRSRAQRIDYLGDDYKKLFVENPTMLKEMIYSSQKRLVGRDTIDINHQHLCILTAIDRSNNIYTTSMSFKLVNVSHRHCVFTIDENLRDFFLNDRSLLNCLFHAVNSVVSLMFYNMNKSKNFTPGFIMVLHTFGRDLKWNPHIHCLISEGGFSDDGFWRHVYNRCSMETPFYSENCVSMFLFASSTLIFPSSRPNIPMLNLLR